MNQKPLTSLYAKSKIVLSILLLIICTIISPPPIQSQDIIATPTDLPTATETPSATPTFTEMPTATATETATLTPIPTETPTETATATLTETPSETPTLAQTPMATLAASPTETAIGSETATLTETPSETPTATLAESATQTATALPPEPELALLSSNNFDEGQYPRDWDLRLGWLLMPSPNEPGYALWVRNLAREATFIGGFLSDMVLETRLLLEFGSIEISVRANDTDRYLLIIRETGQLDLYRGTALLQSATLGSLQGSWHTLRLSVLGDMVRVFVDNVEVMVVSDSAPLPPGAVQIASDQISGAHFWLDDLAIWGSAAELAAAPQTAAQVDSEMLAGAAQVTATGFNYRLAYIRCDYNQAIRCNIDALNTDGSTTSPLVADGGTDDLFRRWYMAAWSPDGSQMAYVSESGSNQELRVLDIPPDNSQGVNSITLASASGGITCPSWSPDGSRIAFSAYLSPSLGRRVYTIASDGSQTSPTLLSGPTPSFFCAHWSPQNDWIAYGEYRSSPYNDFVMYLANGETGEIRQLAIVPDVEGYLHWSPDGTKIAYAGYTGSPNYWDVFSIDAQSCIQNVSQCGLQPVNLTNSAGDEVEPTWSPDGSRLAYVGGYYPSSGIFVMDAMPGAAASLVPESLASDEFPAWSPDGQWIAVKANPSCCNFYDDEIHVLRVDGSQPRQVVTDDNGNLDVGSSFPFWQQPLAVTCTGSLIDTVIPPYTFLQLRDRPDGSMIDLLEPGSPVNLLDGAYDSFGEWWWHITLVADSSVEGYVHWSVVNNSSNCQQREEPPPPLPQPLPNEACFVRLTAASAEVRDGNGQTHQEGQFIRTITDSNQLIRVYGTSYDRTLLLINLPGALQQEWVLATLFSPDPLDARACLNRVLGRFNRDTRPEYLTVVGAYANEFRAPISPAQFSNEYALFRNSFLYVPGTHDGNDLVYRPPDGTGNSIPFGVYAQANGVVVDAGPDGITKTYQFERNYCGQTSVPGNQYPGRGGVFYWAVSIGSETCGVDGSGQPITGIREIYFVAVTGAYDETLTTDDERKAEEPSNGYYDFGLTLDERNTLQRNFLFTNVCSSSPGFCVDSPGRRLIIWYDVANDEPNNGPDRPEIQTVYYHVAVDLVPQYGDWRSICSVDRNTTWTKTIIEDDPAYDMCEITTSLNGFPLGEARRIGFATAPHLHYEVYIDRDNNGLFDGADDDREDPLMAFWTIR